MLGPMTIDSAGGTTILVLFESDVVFVPVSVSNKP